MTQEVMNEKDTSDPIIDLLVRILDRSLREGVFGLKAEIMELEAYEKRLLAIDEIIAPEGLAHIICECQPLVDLIKETKNVTKNAIEKGDFSENLMRKRLERKMKTEIKEIEDACQFVLDACCELCYGDTHDSEKFRNSLRSSCPWIKDDSKSKNS